MSQAVAELILSATVALACWPSLNPANWRQYSDDLAAAIVLMLEVAAIAGLLHSLALLLT